jgi:plastocyanin
MTLTFREYRCAVFAATLLGSNLALADSLMITVTDNAGNPVVDAVVYAEPAAGQVLPKALHPAEIEQRKRKFIPKVTVVQAGTEISFPNNDSVKHHVYSFSPAKVFDLPLYSGKSAEPQLFDKAGTVVLGCNIHDQMIAYVQVVNTPYFAKTDASGKGKLENVLPGKYILKAWYYSLPPNAQIVEQPLTMIGGDSNAVFKLNIKLDTPAS